MFCQKCGAQNNEGVRFCQSCGQAFGSVETKSTAAPKYEAISVAVEPYKENATIELYESFGWEFYNSQTIDSKDTHLEDGGTVIWSVTEHTNYVKLQFKRDKNIENYNKLAELEKEYFNNKPLELNYTMYIAGAAVAAVGWFLFLITRSLPTFLIAAAGIALLGIRFRNGKETEKLNQKRYEIQKKMLAEAKSLTQNN